MLRILSWNVARATGSRLDAVAAVVREEAPDLLLLQEAVDDALRLPRLLGGDVRFEPAFRIAAAKRATGVAAEGMALWSPTRLDGVGGMNLGGWPWPRVALWCRLGGLTVCNLHLSHLPRQQRRPARHAGCRNR